MSITATELKENLSKYLMLAATEDVYITQYGKVVAKLRTRFGTGWMSCSKENPGGRTAKPFSSPQL